MSTEVTPRDMAHVALSYFYTKERAEGAKDQTVYTFHTRDDAPEWVRAMVREAHGEQMPSDRVYQLVHDALDFINDGNGDDDAPYFADDAVDIYTADRRAWLSESPLNEYYVDEAVAAYGYPGTVNEAIAYGQAYQAQEVYEIVIQALLNAADEANQEASDEAEAVAR